MPNIAKNEVLGLVPARGGSKSVPLKNLAPLGGHPMIEYGIQHARSAMPDVVYKLVCSTDHDGIADAAILIVYETRFRPDQAPNENWLARQRGKIERGLDALEAAPPSIDPVDVGAIAVVCALGYLDFRKQVDWRARNPGLISWVDDFAAAVPSHFETRPDA